MIINKKNTLKDILYFILLLLTILNWFSQHKSSDILRGHPDIYNIETSPEYHGLIMIVNDIIISIINIIDVYIISKHL